VTLSPCISNLASFEIVTAVLQKIQVFSANHFKGVLYTAKSGVLLLPESSIMALLVLFMLVAVCHFSL
jgi:hypothetical protein